MRALVPTGQKGLYRDAADPQGDLVWARRDDEVYDTLEEAQRALVVLAKVYSKHKKIDTDEPKPARRKMAGAGQLHQAAVTQPPLQIKVKSEPRELPRTVADTGKTLVGQTLVIECEWDGCPETRTIKPQDAFQVKYCVRHQEEHRRVIRAARARLKRAEKRARDNGES